MQGLAESMVIRKWLADYDKYYRVSYTVAGSEIINWRGAFCRSKADETPRHSTSMSHR